MSQVQLTVSSQLSKIVSELDKIAKQSGVVEKELAKAGDSVEGSISSNTKRVERFLDATRGVAARVSSQIMRDFKALASINAVQGAMSLSNQFKGTVTDSVSLSDTIRKLGTTFGIASSQFSNFQSKITKGLGDVGLSSQVATDSLQALVDTPVRGQDALIAYSKAAGELGSITGHKEQTGGIAKGVAEVIRSRGGDVNNLKQVSAVAEDLRRVFNVTGQGPVQTLNNMKSLYETMPSDLRKKISTRGLVNLSAAEQVAGPGSTKFLEELLGKSPIARQALKSQGFGDVIGTEGLNVEQFRKASKAILERIGMDPEMSAQTLGISEEAAKGFVRLSQSLDKVQQAQQKLQTQTGSLDEQYKKSMGFAEAWGASLNRVKGSLSGILSSATQKGTDLLSNASQSAMGSGAVVAGGGLLAALLAGGGLRGIGGLLKGEAQSKALEALTGEKAIPVQVINWPAGGLAGLGGLGGGAAAGGAAATTVMGALGTAATAVGVGTAAGYAAKYIATGGLEDDISSLLSKIGEYFNGPKPVDTGPVPYDSKEIHVNVHMQHPQLPGQKTSARGRAQ